jgi:hypothetical protein
VDENPGVAWEMLRSLAVLVRETEERAAT